MVGGKAGGASSVDFSVVRSGDRHSGKGKPRVKGDRGKSGARSRPVSVNREIGKDRDANAETE